MAERDRDDENAKLLGRALAVLRARRGLTQAQAGEQAQISAEGWRKYENGAPGIFKPSTQARLTEALASSPDELAEELMRLGGEAPGRRLKPQLAAELALLPIRDRVQAGAWLEAYDFDQGPPRLSTTAADPRYPQADQWLSEVGGDSVNKLGILEGDLVHCVDYNAVRVTPRHDDIVEVERIRHQGAMRELTLKQVEVVGSELRLWPRSTNPRWHQPIVLTDGVRDGEEMEVRIRGLVIAVIRRL